MNQYNAIIDLNPCRLGYLRSPWSARQHSSFVARMLNAPDDVTDVFVRIFKPNNGGFFDIPATQNGNGDWTARVIGTCFPAVGDGWYEVHGTDADGNPTSLGKGKCKVYPFSIGGNAILPGAPLSVATLPDETGALHQIVAVQLGDEWTYKVLKAN